MTARGGLHVEPETLRSMGTPRWAVLVGVSSYRDPRLRLQYAHRDVQELWKVLKTNACGAFVEERARILVDEEATTAAITQAIRSFLQQAQGDDLVLVYFSGHSAPDPGRPKNLYFLTHDTNLDDVAATALPMREIRHSLDENLDARRVIMLMDTCHAAAAGAKGAADGSDAAAFERYLAELKNAKDGFAFFASSEAGEQSREHARWGGGHGLFTHLVLEGLRGKADLDKNGLVTLGELFDYVTQQTPIEGGPGSQHPLVGPQKFDRKLVVAVTGGVDARARLAVGREVYRMAVELGDRRRFAAAARYLSEADDLASVERGLPEARMLAGLALLGAGEGEKACAALRAAFDASERQRKAGESGVPESRYYLAAALAIQGAPEAASHFEAFARDPAAGPRAAVAHRLGELVQTPAQRGRSRALLIGVGVYRHRVANPLRGPANDVTLMRDALLAPAAGFTDGDVECLVDDQATGSAVRSVLCGLRDGAPADAIVVYFSGRSLGADREHLVLYDTRARAGDRFERALAVAELHELAAALPARRIVVVLDTHASQAHLDLARAAGAYSLLVAASPGEKAYEVVFEKSGQAILAGIMTFALTQALAELGTTARWRDIVASLQKRIESRGFAQTPSFVGSEDDPFLGRPLSADPALVLRASLFGAGRGRSAVELEDWRQQVASLIDAPFPELHLAVGRELARQGHLIEATAALDGAGTSSEVRWWRAWIAARRGHLDQAIEHTRGFVDELTEPERSRWSSEAEAAIAALRDRPRRALVVGIDRYSGPEVGRLSDAVQNATAVARALGQLGFPRERVQVLRDDEATTARILVELLRLVDDAHDGPLLFYFAGNGSTGPTGPTLLGADARKEGVHDIALDELRRVAAHPNLTCIVDADTDGLEDGGVRYARWAPVDLRAQPEVRTGAARSGAVTIASRRGYRLTAPLLQALRRKRRPATWSSWAAESGATVAIDVHGGDDRVFHDVLGDAAAVAAFLSRARVAPFAKAAAVLREMLVEGRVHPRDGWVDIGVARALCGDVEGAVDALRSAIAAVLSGHHPEAHYQLGRVLVESGTDLARAQSELGLAVKADPDDPAVKYYLGAAIRGFLEGESAHISRRAQQVWQDYLEAGAPLGHRDEVERFLAQTRAR